MEPEAVFQGEQHGAAPFGVADVDPGENLSYQRAPGPQALGELRPASLRARGVQDQLDVQQRRTTERIITIAVGDPKRSDEIRRRAVARQQLAVMPDGPVDVIL